MPNSYRIFKRLSELLDTVGQTGYIYLTGGTASFSTSLPYIKTLTGIAGLTGGGSTKLDGQNIANYAVGDLVSFYINDSAKATWMFRVSDVGTLPSEDADVILPDTPSGTKFWALVFADSQTTTTRADSVLELGNRKLNARSLELGTQLAPAFGGTGISSLGTGVATWLGTPSVANLNTALGSTLVTTTTINNATLPGSFTTLSASGAATAASLAINGATLGGNALAVNGSAEILGGAAFNKENSSWSFDAITSGRIGFMKKGGANPKLVFASGMGLEIAQSSFTDVSSAHSYTTILQIGSGAAVSITGTLSVTNASTFSSRINLASYTVGTLPAAGVAGGAVHVSDAGGNGPCVAISNGTNWKRCDNTGTTVS